MILVSRRVWRTATGELVPDGSPDAAFLAYAPGMAVPDLVAAHVGLTAALAGDPAPTVEVPPAAVVPSATANLSPTTVVPDPVTTQHPAAVPVPDASVAGQTAPAAPVARIVEPQKSTRKGNA